MSTPTKVNTFSTVDDVRAAAEVLRGGPFMCSTQEWKDAVDFFARLGELLSVGGCQAHLPTGKCLEYGDLIVGQVTHCCPAYHDVSVVNPATRKVVSITFNSDGSIET